MWPHTRTYIVKPLDNRQDIRCVKVSEGRPSTKIPKLAWYDEGNWEGSTYSHIGTRSFNGYGAGDIYRNGFVPICNNFG